MNATSTTIITGNATEDPRLSHLSDGTAVTRLRVASTPRRYDRASGQWRDGDTVFLNIVCWRQLAENAAASIRKGDALVCYGRLTFHDYTSQQGERRSNYELDATHLGPDLNRGVARLTRITRSGAGTGDATTGGTGHDGAPEEQVPVATTRSPEVAPDGFTASRAAGFEADPTVNPWTTPVGTSSAA